MLSITQNPRFWVDVPVIYLAKKGNKQIREVLNLPDTKEYARLSDFFDNGVTYKIKQQVDDAAKSRIQNKFQTDLVKLDKRVSLLYSAIGGGILRIYPIQMMKIINGFLIQKFLKQVLLEIMPICYLASCLLIFKP